MDADKRSAALWRLAIVLAVLVGIAALVRVLDARQQTGRTTSPRVVDDAPTPQPMKRTVARRTHRFTAEDHAKAKATRARKAAEREAAVQAEAETQAAAQAAAESEAA